MSISCICCSFCWLVMFLFTIRIYSHRCYTRSRYHHHHHYHFLPLLFDIFLWIFLQAMIVVNVNFSLYLSYQNYNTSAIYYAHIPKWSMNMQKLESIRITLIHVQNLSQKVALPSWCLSAVFCSSLTLTYNISKTFPVANGPKAYPARLSTNLLLLHPLRCI